MANKDSTMSRYAEIALEAVASARKGFDPKKTISSIKQTAKRFVSIGSFVAVVLLPAAAFSGQLNCIPDPLPFGYRWALHRYYYDFWSGSTYYEGIQDIGNTSTNVSIFIGTWDDGKDYNLYKILITNVYSQTIYFDSGIIRGSSVPYPWNISPGANVPAPQPPINFTVSTNLSEGVILTWNTVGVDHAVSYEIWRSDNSSNGATLLTALLHTNRAYAESIPFTGSKYYQIRAVNFNSASAFSGPLCGGWLNGVSSILPTSRTFSKEGGGGAITVSADDQVNWRAQPSSSWIVLSSNSQSGVGSGAVSYMVGPSYQAETREGHISFGTFARVDIFQTGHDLSISPTSSVLSSAATSITVNVVADVGISWSSSETQSWISVVGTNGGTGSGSVFFAIQSNPSGQPRSATIQIAGKSHSVSQAGRYFITPVDPTNATYPAEGGTGTVFVTVNITNNWDALPSANWISVVSGSPGIGPSSFTYAVDEFFGRGVSRTGVLFVAGGEVEITQGAAAAGDRLPFFWSQENGCEGPNEDQDGDGSTNWEEWLADTDPNDPGSYLIAEFIPATFPPNEYLLTWLSATNRRYSIYSTSSLLDVWPTQPTYETTGTGGRCVYTNNINDAKKFMRIRVDLP